jgi:hypothetical protein
MTGLTRKRKLKAKTLQTKKGQPTCAIRGIWHFVGLRNEIKQYSKASDMARKVLDIKRCRKLIEGEKYSSTDDDEF